MILKPQSQLLLHIAFNTLADISAKVEICRHGCLDHCQLSDSVAHYIQERKDQIRPQYVQSTVVSTPDDYNNSADKHDEDVDSDAEQEDGSLYDDVIQNSNEMASIDKHFLDVEKLLPKAQAQKSNRLPPTITETQPNSEIYLDDLSKSFMVTVKTRCS